MTPSAMGVLVFDAEGAPLKIQADIAYVLQPDNLIRATSQATVS